MIIYKATNQVNGKVYIGRTVGVLRQRINSHKCDVNKRRTNGYLHKAIRRYGFKNFKWQVICICHGIDVLNEMETYYINHYNSMNRDFGYNLTEGGGGMVGWSHSEKSIKKMIEAKLGKPGKKWSTESKQKMSEAVTGAKNHNYGKRHTEEHKQKIIKTLIGRKCSEETRKKIGDAQRGEKGNMYGKHHSEAIKKKIRESIIRTLYRKRGIYIEDFQFCLFKTL